MLTFRLAGAGAWTTKHQCSSSSKGLATIHRELVTAINQRGIPLFHVAYTVEGAGLRPHDATFIVATKVNRTESLMFTREEIADSPHRIDSFADAKVRVLVSRCTGGLE